ncbi:DUF995 domain-containing protein [Mesorhizobium sp. BAC0120]|uniref:DUF995 domain-containing protein n=1 Tax=Mesorhizobium sp. BAC0120 TaxID=3090670 RepID=UPI00298CF447|nr:DUF995 domain-containing protein [Mesorhizobium sp. BAC0120]MDW6023474.1 DUF995 domain-containing protein [Mesorhizobium sp. BAC0120]
MQNSRFEKGAAVISGRLAATSLLFAAVLFGSVAEAASTASLPPPDARPMTSGELFMLYRDKSWRWPDGAGWMQADGRRFTAWAGSGAQASWAEGRWIITDGRLCLKAQWHSSTGVAPDKTCFSHMKLRDTVYQKREPSGAWYVFRHAPPQDGDEFSKLVGQDLVSTDLERIRSELLPPMQSSHANSNANQ